MIIYNEREHARRFDKKIFRIIANSFIANHRTTFYEMNRWKRKKKKEKEREEKEQIKIFASEHPLYPMEYVSVVERRSGAQPEMPDEYS